MEYKDFLDKAESVEGVTSIEFETKHSHAIQLSIEGNTAVDGSKSSGIYIHHTNGCKNLIPIQNDYMQNVCVGNVTRNGGTELTVYGNFKYTYTNMLYPDRQFPLHLQHGKTYTISQLPHFAVNTEIGNIYCQVFGKQKSSGVMTTNNPCWNEDKTFTVDNENNDYFFSVCNHKWTGEISEENAVTISCMLNEGETVLPYEPFIGEEAIHVPYALGTGDKIYNRYGRVYSFIDGVTEDITETSFGQEMRKIYSFKGNNCIFCTTDNIEISRITAKVKGLNNKE